MSKRQFNKLAYDEYDMNCKVATVNLMSKKGYNLIGDINTEYYKKYDLAFKNLEGNIIKIENEFRGGFENIKNKFSTVHIPIRKKNTECDFYFIWGNNYEELAIINKDILTKFKDNIINQICAKGKEYEFEEEFIDIPKQYIKFYKINKQL